MGLWLIVGFLVFAWVVELPRRLRAQVLLGIWGAFVLVQLLLPHSALAARIGGSARGWLVLGVLVAVVFAYRRALARLRARAAPPPAGEPARTVASGDVPVSDAELDRYARHLVLREIGGAGQMRLRDARVLIAGAGGLGAPVCLYLAAAGVGHITLADDDTVSLSNLQRQVIFRTDQQGLLKAEAAADAIKALNPHVHVSAMTRRVTAGDADLIGAHDLVIDGTDSFAARAEINRACVAAQVPLIAGAISQWEGQVTLYDPLRGGPCMACLFPAAPAAGLAPPCAEAGVIGPLPGVIGSMMALEAIKLLAAGPAQVVGQGLRGRMVLFDGLYGETRTITTSARTDCPVCDAA